MFSCVVGLSAVVSSGAPVVLQPADVAREFEIRSWRHEQGLPDNRVKGILQTRDGYLWLATLQGLARFDGQKFTVFNHLNTLEFVSQDCTGLAEDNEGNLWIATYDALIRKQGNSFARFDVDDDYPAAQWAFLCASRRGGVVVVSNAAFVGWLHRDQVRRFERGGKPWPIVYAVSEDEKSGLVWTCTLHGLVSYDPANSKFQDAPLGQDFECLPALAICRGRDAEHWVLFAEPSPDGRGQGPGTWCACFKDGRWLRSPEKLAPDFHADWKGGRFITLDPFGALWLSGITNSLHRFVDGRTQLIRRAHADEKDYVLCVYSDREGNLWLGTESGGLERWSERKVVTYTANDGLVGDSAWTIHEARDGGVWIGNDGGLCRLTDNRFANIPLQRSGTQGNVRAIAQDQNGVLWVGTMNGLLCISNGAISSITFPGEWFETKIRALLPAKDGGVWVATVRGLTLLKNGRRTKYTKADGLGSDEPRALLENRAGDLWIGTLGGGLSRFREGRFTTYSTNNGLSSENVWALHEDSNGVLWAGTDNGLNRLKEGRITTFTTSQGLPVPDLNCILEDHLGRFWISHARGLYWLYKKDLEEVAAGRRANVRPVQYDDSDGLLTTEFNGQKSFPSACKTRDGRLWFPTAKGVVVLDPSKALFDEVAPVSVIEQVRANGEIVYGNGPDDRLRPCRPAAGTNLPPRYGLPPGSGRVLEFRYTANTFVAPEKARFKYRLRGFADGWLDADTRREAYFSGLRPGAYEFEVLACNHHGVWQEHGATFAFELAPFYYQAWWFYAGTGGGLAAVVALFVTWRVREVRKMHQLEQANALNEQRKRIARDIHDELGASLTHILQLSAENGANLSQPGQAQSQSKQIASIAEEAVDNIGEIVWANNPKYDTVEDLVTYLREYTANFLAATSLQVQLDFPDILPSRPVSGLFRRHVLMVVKEALQNIVKHAAATQVSFRLSLTDDHLELRIVDNGRGFYLKGEGGNGNGLGSGNGLTNMRHRVTELRGTFTLSSDPAHGTTLHISIPVH